MVVQQLSRALSATRSKKFILFLVSILIAFSMMWLLSPPSFTIVQNAVLFTLFFAICLWVSEAIPAFSVSVLILGLLVVIMGTSGAGTPMRYVQTWSSSVIWLFLGGFFLAEGMKKTKLDMLVLRNVLPWFGNSPSIVLLGLMMITAIMSMLMSNTATTAMMIATMSPLFSGLSERQQFSKAILLGIPSAASVGGMGTIIGTVPNAIAVGALANAGYTVSFVDWLIIGMPLAIVLLLVFWWVLVKKYQVNQQDSLDFAFLQAALSEEPSDKELLHRTIVLITLAVTLFCWFASDLIGVPVAAAAGIPIVVFAITGVMDAKDIRGLSWETLMLVAGGLALGLAIEDQKIAVHFVDQLSKLNVSFYCLLGVFAVLTMLLSNFMSHTAATTILVPVGLSLLPLFGNTVNPLILPLVIALSSSCALFLPVSTPPNAIAFSTGLIRQSEFRLGGTIIGLLGPILSILWVLVVINLFF